MAFLLLCKNNELHNNPGYLSYTLSYLTTYSFIDINARSMTTKVKLNTNNTVISSTNTEQFCINVNVVYPNLK